MRSPVTDPSDPTDTTQAAPDDGGRAPVWRVLRRRFVLAAGLGLAIYAALAVYADWSLLRETLVSFPWQWLPAILGLVLANYVGRLVKWLWYLRVVGSPIRRSDGARVFVIGMSMVLTPAKAGELLKSYMVRNASGTPISVTAPIVLAERLTDGLAMLVLAFAGLLGVAEPGLRRAATIALVALLAVVLLVQVRPLALAALRFGEGLPGMRRPVAHARDFYESSYTLLRPRNLLLAVLIGTVSWTCEGLAYYLVLLGVEPALAPGLDTAARAVFIFSISTVLGALVATPGGLGATEASLVALSRRILGLGATTATAAALLIRFATLWFGVGIGLAGMALWPELLEGHPDGQGGPAGSVAEPAGSVTELGGQADGA
jgi:uncharacterized membrane protein YbhN (UPF0104 family)